MNVISDNIAADGALAQLHQNVNDNILDSFSSS